ncbi:MAG: M28 family peptidase [Myxococcales bacterium]|nr:M28 family peptidase [Myxococcales bacterium]
MTTARSEPVARWQPWSCLLVLALVAGLAALRGRPPAPAAADAPATEFSAARARAVLERIVGDQAPHGVGTPANAAVRERIVAELEGLGLTVERQAAFSCRGIVCAPVVNVLAEVPGREADGPIVLLTSHYDSVHAGPGVADDLHGVALGIETARALLAADPPRHPVRLLIDEGEEVGLLGAAAFVDRHPDLHRVGVVVNAEARGTSGTSSMFETSSGNRALVAAHAAAVTRPQATSLAQEIYARMPNDTDLTVFREAGRAGLNFAFVGEVGWYHTPLDDLAHLDLGSVQHQGDHVLATVRALASGPLPLPTTEDAVFGDVLGLGIIAWPASWAEAVPLGLLAVLAVLAAVAARRRGLRPWRLGLGPVAIVGGVVLTAVLAFVAAWLVSTAHGEPIPAHANPLPLRLGLWGLAVGVALVLAGRLGRAARPLELALGISMSWAVVAWILAVTAPGASVVLCVPLGGAVLGLGWALSGPRREHAGLLLASVLLVAQWATMALTLEDVFGLGDAPVVAIPIAVAVTGILPAAMAPAGRGRGPLVAVGVVTVVALAVAAVVPVYDARRPRRIALVHYDDRAQGAARLVALAADALPPSVREAGALSEDAHPVLPWTGRPMHEGPAVPRDEPAPELVAVEGGAPGDPRHVRARLRSRRGADRAVVLLPRADVHGVWVEGRPVDTASDGRLLVFGLPPGGVILDLELSAHGAVEATVIDCASGIPSSSQAVVEARDAADAMTFQWGDVGCIGTRVVL